MPSSPAPAGGPRRLTPTLYGYAFLDEFVLLTRCTRCCSATPDSRSGRSPPCSPSGPSPASSWRCPPAPGPTEPPGAGCSCLAPLLTAAGFALWVLLPSYGAFAVGFVLWGAAAALGSGTLEALVYEELERSAPPTGTPGSWAGPAPADWWPSWRRWPSPDRCSPAGGYRAVGAASVLACLLAAATATRFPEHRAPAAGVRAAGPRRCAPGSPRPARTVGPRGAAARPGRHRGVEALDEYTPLLVAGHRRGRRGRALAPRAGLGRRHRRGPAGRTRATARQPRPRRTARGRRLRPGRWAPPRAARPGLALDRPRLRRLPARDGAGGRPAPAAHRGRRPGHPDLGRRAWAAELVTVAVYGGVRARSGHGLRARRRLRPVRGAVPGRRPWPGAGGGPGAEAVTRATNRRRSGPGDATIRSPARNGSSLSARAPPTVRSNASAEAPARPPPLVPGEDHACAPPCSRAPAAPAPSSRT